MKNFLYSGWEYGKYKYDITCLSIKNTLLARHFRTNDELNESFSPFALGIVPFLLQIDFK
jgi:hypothetical protein